MGILLLYHQLIDNFIFQQKKRAIVLTGRIHPGETPASWIMKGVLEFLTSEHPKAIVRF